VSWTARSARVFGQVWRRREITILGCGSPRTGPRPGHSRPPSRRRRHSWSGRKGRYCGRRRYLRARPAGHEGRGKGQRHTRPFVRNALCTADLPKGSEQVDRRRTVSAKIVRPRALGNQADLRAIGGVRAEGQPGPALPAAERNTSRTIGEPRLHSPWKSQAVVSTREPCPAGGAGRVAALAPSSPSWSLRPFGSTGCGAGAEAGGTFEMSIETLVG
jgi:hypothetical protein